MGGEPIVQTGGHRIMLDSARCWSMNFLIYSSGNRCKVFLSSCIIICFILFQGIQLGPTELSIYWIYWVPAQYVDAVKDTILGKWQTFF